MLPSLAALIALQTIDSAVEASRRRQVELPKAAEAIDARIAALASEVDVAKVRLQESQAARRALEKDVAGVDSRLARFEDHKAAVKTNQEYTALLHEIATAKAEKDAIEERILVLMEEADVLAAGLKASETTLAQAKQDAETARAQLAAEATTLEAELARLAAERAERRTTIDGRSLAIYDQLVKVRRGVAVAQMTGEMCTACHVRLRPHVAQVVRRNEEIVQCESCQRILYHAAPAQPAEASAG